MLNVVIEVHYKSLDEFEITVKTAMCSNDFRAADNQYVIEIFDYDSSILKRMVNKRLLEVCAV